MNPEVDFTPKKLPVPSEKELQAINQLMADKKYRIKVPASFLHTDKSDKINPEFILYMLNDYLGHVQTCVAATKKMFPLDNTGEFFKNLEHHDSFARKTIQVILNIDVRSLNALLVRLQANPREVTVSQLEPFMRILFRSLILIYYLGAGGVIEQYQAVHSFILQEIIPADMSAFQANTSQAMEEWRYVFEKVIPALYPLVLRMSVPVMLSSYDLFYKNGSKVLEWLDVDPKTVLFLQKKEAVLKAQVSPEDEEKKMVMPVEVEEGIKVLEDLFPEAGWNKLETMPDFCAYFQPILEFRDAFTQLSPGNPLHQTMILFWILEYLFQALRLVRFDPMTNLPPEDSEDSIDRILDEWILYQENIFDKNFSDDLKAYTNQIYAQPDYNKTPYGSRMLSNMFTLIKVVFLPYLDIRMYGTSKLQDDDRLPPFYTRVARLKQMLEYHNKNIQKALSYGEPNPEASITGIQNPWKIYNFTIPNSVSRRLDALCGGKTSKTRTNALLIQYTLKILNVLNWWINDSNSYAYRNVPPPLYRVIENGSTVPAFGVTPRTDVDEIFKKHLRERMEAAGGTPVNKAE
ncbi:hypothetical protein K7I13_09740 [Brucepastera parasyntrophica]|uniref:hypothetical protein n=1 Tax=Brucepastera parasyntrophica TaxID=2880008 RepID=UPI00210AA082|nr:hypothetical protein [Brucepastera parasyntrophica]ULQ58815.1 hypothetical protein K7I13_09740 [Brucepastera parasyntrophica]